jgi:hypothetical protein
MRHRGIRVAVARAPAITPASQRRARTPRHPDDTVREDTAMTTTTPVPTVGLPDLATLIDLGPRHAPPHADRPCTALCVPECCRPSTTVLPEPRRPEQRSATSASPVH